MRAQGFFRLVPLLVLLMILSGAVGAVTLVGASAQGDGFHSQIYVARTEPLKQAKALYVGHEAVAQFDEIPDWARTAASNMRVLQLRASTGMYISSGLCCLQGRRYDTYIEPSPCGDPRNICSDPYGLDNWNRANWHFIHYSDICEPEPDSDGGKVDCFAEVVPAHPNSYDVFSMKFCYTPFWEPFWDVDNLWAYYRDTMEQLEAAYPDKIFIWWTKPLMVPEAEVWTYCEDVQEFNRLVREYCQANDKILYDIADIEAHDDNGNRCYDGCESMCSECSGGGHPSDLGCRIRLAKAYWVLMAKIAGWTPTCDLPGDLNCDCAVDMTDIMLVANCWGTSMGDDDYNPAYDLDGDGDIDIVDIMLVAVHWGETCEG